MFPTYSHLDLTTTATEIASFWDEHLVFEASVDKSIILFDQDKNLVSNEKQTVSVDGVNGPKIVVGSMNEVKTTGNWPKNFSNKD